mmetsp:Transcript_2252/g.3485  ORF Transcript_2252/g.3485 Transcript_2252/m.3485 type:complete len:271 (-) Transcript_2252:35-847(-)
MELSYYTEIGTIIANVDNEIGGHLRVKEIYESFEVYKEIANFIVATQRTLQSLQSTTSNTTTTENITYPKVEKIVELACGHGLVGLLLAYRFPHLQVSLYDLFARPTYAAFVQSFEKYGFKRPGESLVLPNVQLFEQDIYSTGREELRNSVVVCVHGCGQVNQHTIEMAISSGAAGWAVLPCCIVKESYLDASCSVQLSGDSTRYHVLCGALAHRYRAQLVAEIDQRITNRYVFIAGGVGVNGGDHVVEAIGNDVEVAARRGRLPKLSLS